MHLMAIMTWPEAVPSLPAQTEDCSKEAQGKVFSPIQTLR